MVAGLFARREFLRSRGLTLIQILKIKGIWKYSLFPKAEPGLNKALTSAP
jgi:hypothetical protein